MKSVVQEGSTIIKAVEQGWKKAKMPREFTVKVLEEPKTNFIGMTIHSAKVALFFDERQIVRDPNKKIRRSSTDTRGSAPKTWKSGPKKQQSQPQTFTKDQTIWTDELVTAAHKWIKQSLLAMERPDISFNTNVNKYYLRFTFDKPIFEDEEKERNLFRSFSFLMLQALRNKFKRPLRGFKIVLTREQYGNS